MAKQNDDQAETEKSTLETTQEAEKKQAKDLNKERSAQLSRRDGRSQLFSDDLVDDLSEAVKDGKLTYEKMEMSLSLRQLKILIGRCHLMLKTIM